MVITHVHPTSITFIFEPKRWSLLRCQYRYDIMSISYNTPETVHICILIFNQKLLFRINTYETRKYSDKKTEKII